MQPADCSFQHLHSDVFTFPVVCRGAKIGVTVALLCLSCCYAFGSICLKTEHKLHCPRFGGVCCYGLHFVVCSKKIAYKIDDGFLATATCSLALTLKLLRGIIFACFLGTGE